MFQELAEILKPEWINAKLCVGIIKKQGKYTNKIKYVAWLGCELWDLTLTF